MKHSVIIIIIIQVSYFLHIISPINIQCKFTNVSYWSLSEGYSCEVQNILNITSYDLATITNISGDHMKHRSNSDEMCFYASNKTTVYLLRGIERFFKNLIGIFIIQNGLKYIQRDDFKPFPNLTNIDFFGNEIEVLEDDLFMYNSKLNSISFDANPLIHIGWNVFGYLLDLHSLVFFNCKCGSGGKTNSTHNTKVLIFNIKPNCNQKDFSHLNSIIKNLDVEMKNLKVKDISIIFQKLNNLERDFKKSNFSHYEPFERKIRNLNTQKQKMLSPMIEVMDKISKNEQMSNHFKLRYHFLFVIITILGIIQIVIVVLIYKISMIKT
ncbi:hypothetical protein ACKWTF_001562 [Chironomus riparius]